MAWKGESRRHAEVQNRRRKTFYSSMEEIGSGQSLTNEKRNRAYWLNYKTGNILDLESKRCRSYKKKLPEYENEGTYTACPIVFDKNILGSIFRQVPYAEGKINEIKQKVNGD